MRREEGDKGGKRGGRTRSWAKMESESRRRSPRGKRKGREGGGRQKREMKTGERKQRRETSAGFVTFPF